MFRKIFNLCKSANPNVFSDVTSSDAAKAFAEGDHVRFLNLIATDAMLSGQTFGKSSLLPELVMGMFSQSALKTSDGQSMSCKRFLDLFKKKTASSYNRSTGSTSYWDQSSSDRSTSVQASLEIYNALVFKMISESKEPVTLIKTDRQSSTFGFFDEIHYLKRISKAKNYDSWSAQLSEFQKSHISIADTTVLLEREKNILKDNLVAQCIKDAWEFINENSVAAFFDVVFPSRHKLDLLGNSLDSQSRESRAVHKFYDAISQDQHPGSCVRILLNAFDIKEQWAQFVLIFESADYTLLRDRIVSKIQFRNSRAISVQMPLPRTGQTICVALAELFSYSSLSTSVSPETASLFHKMQARCFNETALPLDGFYHRGDRGPIGFPDNTAPTNSFNVLFPNSMWSEIYKQVNHKFSVYQHAIFTAAAGAMRAAHVKIDTKNALDCHRAMKADILSQQGELSQELSFFDEVVEAAATIEISRNYFKDYCGAATVAYANNNWFASFASALYLVVTGENDKSAFTDIMAAILQQLFHHFSEALDTFQSSMTVQQHIETLAMAITAKQVSTFPEEMCGHEVTNKFKRKIDARAKVHTNVKTCLCASKLIQTSTVSEAYRKKFCIPDGSIPVIKNCGTSQGFDPHCGSVYQLVSQAAFGLPLQLAYNNDDGQRGCKLPNTFSNELVGDTFLNVDRTTEDSIFWDCAYKAGNLIYTGFVPSSRSSQQGMIENKKKSAVKFLRKSATTVVSRGLHRDGIFFTVDSSITTGLVQQKYRGISGTNKQFIEISAACASAGLPSVVATNIGNIWRAVMPLRVTNDTVGVCGNTPYYVGMDAEVVKKILEDTKIDPQHPGAGATSRQLEVYNSRKLIADYAKNNILINFPAQSISKSSLENGPRRFATSLVTDKRTPVKTWFAYRDTQKPISFFEWLRHGYHHQNEQLVTDSTVEVQQIILPTSNQVFVDHVGAGTPYQVDFTMKLKFPDWLSGELVKDELRGFNLIEAKQSQSETIVKRQVSESTPPIDITDFKHQTTVEYVEEFSGKKTTTVYKFWFVSPTIDRIPLCINGMMFTARSSYRTWLMSTPPGITPEQVSLAKRIYLSCGINVEKTTQHEIGNVGTQMARTQSGHVSELESLNKKHIQSVKTMFGPPRELSFRLCIWASSKPENNSLAALRAYLSTFPVWNCAQAYCYPGSEPIVLEVNSETAPSTVNSDDIYDEEYIGRKINSGMMELNFNFKDLRGAQKLKDLAPQIVLVLSKAAQTKSGKLPVRTYLAKPDGDVSDSLAIEVSFVGFNQVKVGELFFEYTSVSNAIDALLYWCFCSKYIAN